MTNQDKQNLLYDIDTEAEQDEEGMSDSERREIYFGEIEEQEDRERWEDEH